MMMRPRSVGAITVVLLALTPAFMAKQPGSIDRTEEQRPVIEFASNAGMPATDGPTSTTANTADVTVAPNGNLTFSPTPVSILVGDTVRWTWAGSFHTVTSGSPCTADSAYCSPNDTNCSGATTSNAGAVYTHTFNQAGTFPYFCQIHCFSNMRGTVQVLTPFINIVSVNHDMIGVNINGQTTATTVHTTVTLTSTSDLTTGFGSATPITANASGAFIYTDGSRMSPRFYRFTYP